MSKRRRTESPNAVFEAGYAQGWAFGVPEAFRASLDISLDMRADKAANEALATTLGRKPTAAERIMRPIWTQGTPPAYDFSRGSMLHEPAHAHTLPWAEALPILTRSVVVLDAKPDGDAASPSANASPAPIVDGDASSGDTLDERSANSSTKSNASNTANNDTDALSPSDVQQTTDVPTNGSGWVEFELYHYENGAVTRKENRRLSQDHFVNFLKRGTSKPH
ncbi:MAG: hypothetical protein Q4D91_14055 [Lautropia sp.]|nr:hypothetical protein [Lautropia sp.]